MKQEAVTFSGSKDRRLVGVLRTPETSTGTGVITVHGWGANRIGPNNMLSDLCRDLADAGNTTLSFDLSGRGDSQGSPEDVSVDDMMEDVVAASVFLKGRGVSKILLFGLCSGGNAALGAAALGAKVDGVIAVSTFPFVPIEDSKAAAKKTAGYAKGYLQKLFRLQTYKKLFSGAISFKGVYRTLFGHVSKETVKSDRVLKDTRHNVIKLLGKFRGSLFHIYASADPETEPSLEYFTKNYGEVGRHPRN